MKRLINHKIYDIVAQLVCALLPMIILWYINDDGRFVCSYLTVGMCDIVSYAANNTEEDKPYHVYARRIFGIALKLILLIGLLSMILISTHLIQLFIGYLYFMFFIWPLMAAFYFLICVAELVKLYSLEKAKTTDYETTNFE